MNSVSINSYSDTLPVADFVLAVPVPLFCSRFHSSMLSQLWQAVIEVVIPAKKKQKELCGVRLLILDLLEVQIPYKIHTPRDLVLRKKINYDAHEKCAVALKPLLPIN